MPIEQNAPYSHDMRSSALVPFLAITFLITWGLIGIYILAPETAAATFGEISGSHPFFFLATWSPAIAAFPVVVYPFRGVSGIRAFLSRLLLWRCSAGWVGLHPPIPAARLRRRLADQGRPGSGAVAARGCGPGRGGPVHDADAGPDRGVRLARGDAAPAAAAHGADLGRPRSSARPGASGTCPPSSCRAPSTPTGTSCRSSSAT